jgi:hypothetical protein
MGQFKPPMEACWWRFRLQPNEDGHTIVERTNATDGDLETATWMSWEIFDGAETVIDTGFDKPTFVRVTYQPSGRHYADVLYVGPPSPAEWEQLTRAGDFVHPDDRERK